MKHESRLEYEIFLNLLYQLRIRFISDEENSDEENISNRQQHHYHHAVLLTSLSEFYPKAILRLFFLHPRLHPALSNFLHLETKENLIKVANVKSS